MRETYDIDETAARAGAALDKLRTEQSPAVRSVRGSKAAVLRAVRDRLRALAGEGYSTGQMTDVLRTVIPSMSARAVRAALREAAREGAKPNKRRAARRTRAGTAGSGDSPPTGSITETAKIAPDGGMPAVARSDAPPANASPAQLGPVSVSADGTSAVPALDAHAPTAVPFSPEQRAQYQIPPWTDGTDVRPGETLERYARRKRAAGPPPDRSKFIGESRVGEF